MENKISNKRIIKVLSNLLQDFENELEENTEWKFGDKGSWTTNIKQSRQLLKELKKNDNGKKVKKEKK